MNFSLSRIVSRMFRILVPLSFVALAAGVSAQPASTAVSTNTATTYPAGSIQSIEAADAALAAVVKERKDIEARYAAEEKACHPKFLATSCIDQAQERRYQAMSQLRKVEVEANAFKRQARVTQRDKALSEHLSKEEAKQQEREKRQQPRESADEEPAENVPEPAAAPSRTKTRIFTDRTAQHEAKMKQLREEEAASAQERAENVAAYERKVQDAQLRQQKVAERKAEKEMKRKKKEGLPPESGTKPE
ncbi:hypothetical protein EGT07_23280 [Herbaspirillum sp. HC18]|nr:hypothetical protein EGT07_23280 [Herbaspirillum sp. HC18]